MYGDVLRRRGAPIRIPCNHGLKKQFKSAYKGGEMVRLHQQIRFSNSPINVASDSYKCIFNKVRRKNNCVHAFSGLIFYCASLIIPDSTILMPKDGLRWGKLLVNHFKCLYS